MGQTTYDAKDPETSFPPIEPLRPPKGAPNVLVVLLDDVGFGASSAFGGPSDPEGKCIRESGKQVGEGCMDRTEPFAFSADETCDLGVDDASAVSPDYTPETSRFTGVVNWVEIDIDEVAEDLDHLITEEERYRVAMGRQ